MTLFLIPDAQQSRTISEKNGLVYGSVDLSYNRFLKVAFN